MRTLIQRVECHYHVLRPCASGIEPLEDKKTAMYAVEPSRQTSSLGGLQSENGVSTDQEERADLTTGILLP